MMRNLCFVTGTRADFGLLSSLIRLSLSSSSYNTQIVASCMHLDHRYGYTLNEILNSGFEVAATVPMARLDDSRSAMVKAVADGLVKFLDVYRHLSPHLIVILGDRYEALAAAQAAFLMGLPVAHIHGGELTEGAIDDTIRHCITKMSYLHFVAAEQYRARVVQLGEDPSRVFCVGALGVENVKKIHPLNQEQVERHLNFRIDGKTFLVTCHPETAGVFDKSCIKNLLDVFQNNPKFRVIFTYPNSDPGSSEISEAIENFCKLNPKRAKIIKSMGFELYIQTARHVAAVIGNSSSAVIEIPSIGIPSVNIGARQQGRLKAPSVIDCDWSVGSIQHAIETALSTGFRNTVMLTNNPYEVDNTSKRILSILENFKFDVSEKKKFFDLEVAYEQ